MNFTKFRFHGP